jgi:ribosomal-protein-alanine N-acetyltransferase
MTPARMAAIHARAFTDHRPWSDSEFAALLDDPQVFCVAQGADCFALGRVVLDEAELLTIATDPAAQRQGLARQCLARFLSDCAARGAARVFLEVDAANAPAQALYGVAGFVESGRRKGYYRHADGQRSDAVLMSTSFSN